jgi:hypothetical protein
MRKIFASLFLFFSFFLTPLFSANPSQPGILQMGVFWKDTHLMTARLGAEYQYTENPKWEFSSEEKGQKYHRVHGHIDSFLPMILWNIDERVDLLLKPGVSVSHVYFSQKKEEFSFKTNSGFYLKAEGRAILLERKEATLGAFGNVFYSSSSLKTFQKNGENFIPVTGRYQTNGWELSLGVSQKFSFFVPCGGVYWKDTKVKFHHLPECKNTLHLENRRKVGFFLGMTISRGKALLFHLEGRFYQETSLSASFEVRI